jgi:hypothetical protein
MQNKSGIQGSINTSVEINKNNQSNLNKTIESK